MRARSDARAAVTVERITVWGAAVLVVAALGVLVVGPGAEFQTATPTADFEGSYEESTGTVTVTHAGGDDLTDGNSQSVMVVAADADNDTTTHRHWANESRGFPITEGDSFAVDDPRIDTDGDGNYLDADGSVGFYLEPGDTIEVVWTGRLTGAPEPRTATLDTITVGNTTG